MTMWALPISYAEARVAEAFSYADSPAAIALRIRVWRDRNASLLKRFAVIRGDKP